MFSTRTKPIETMNVKAYLSDKEIPPDEYYRIMKNAEWKLFNKGFSTSIYGNKIYFVGNAIKPLKKFKINNYFFTLIDNEITLSAKEHNIILCNLVESKLKQKAFSLGFQKAGDQKYHNKTPYKEDFFSYYNAFYSEVEIFTNGDVGIWLDSTTKWKQKMSSFLNWLKIHKPNEVNKYLLNKKVKYPSVFKNRYYTGKIVEIINKSINDYTFKKDSGEIVSIYKYWTRNRPHAIWLERNNIKLSPNDNPIILIEFSKNSTPIPYPPSILELVIDVLDPIIPNNVYSQKKALNPKNRINETLQLYDLLLKDGLTIGGTKLIFERKFFNLNQKKSIIGQHISLQAPILQLGNKMSCKASESWMDPDIKSVLFQYGPVDKKQSIPISYVGPETEINNFRQFHNYLNKHARKMKLGKFQLVQFYPVDRIHPDRYMRICQKLGQEIEDGIVIVILPNTNITKTYIAAKKGLGRHLIKSEMIQWNTYKKLLQESKMGGFSFSNYNIALKAYGRYLKCGEAIWHLKEPAGGLNPTQNNFFMGFDVSRNPETRKESAAYAAVCDNYGRILYKNSIDTHRGERVIGEILSDWFFELASSIYDELNNMRKIDNIFLFKDGPIYTPQIAEYQKGVLLAKKRLIQEHIMDKSSDIKIIAAIKRGLHRFYGEEKNFYRVNYSGLIRDDKDAIILTSRPRKGTASTTRLSLIYQLKNDMNIEQISRIFNDLRYLDWSSLFQQPKTILPLHIVQNLAKLTKEDIIVPYYPR